MASEQESMRAREQKDKGASRSDNTQTQQSTPVESGREDEPIATDNGKQKTEDGVPTSNQTPPSLPNEQSVVISKVETNPGQTDKQETSAIQRPKEEAEGLQSEAKTKFSHSETKSEANEANRGSPTVSTAGKTPVTEANPAPQQSEGTVDSFEIEGREIERRDRELERLKQYGINEEDIAAMESEKADWIDRDKAELERKIRERKQMGDKVAKRGLWRRSIESLAISCDVNFDSRDYLRRLDYGDNFFDILKLPDNSDKRSRSTIGRRYGLRADIDPFSWASFGVSSRFSNDFTKSSGTASRYKSDNYEGNVKIFNSDNASSFQLRYSLSKRIRTSVSGASIAQSISHEPSISWRQSWSSGTKTSSGVRFTFRNQTRSGVKSHSMIITPNFSIDYKLLVKGEWRMPILNKIINLDHNFDMTNTFSTVIRREKFGVNRDERSERFETSLRLNYNLSARLRMNMNLGVSYNKDHVEEGRDYLSIASSIMVRGEFR